MIAAETVQVYLRVSGERDPLGDEVPTWASDPMTTDAIIAPGKTDVLDETRPDGVDIALTAHFPKTWADDLRGAKAVVRGETYMVVGDPVAYTPANTPGAYNLPVEMERCDG